jgi:hypothetical protein
MQQARLRRWRERHSDSLLQCKRKEKGRLVGSSSAGSERRHGGENPKQWSVGYPIRPATFAASPLPIG